MRKIIYSQLVSLDGFMEGENGDLSWSFPSEPLHKHFNDLYLSGEIDTSIYGRKLYQIMESYWPEVLNNEQAPEVQQEFAKIWAEQKKIVYSSTLESVDWNSKLMRDLNRADILELKQQPGSCIEVGGANLASSFLKMGLVDELWLYTFPVLLGSGKRAFPAGLPKKLKLLDSKTFPCRVVNLRYQILNAD